MPAGRDNAGGLPQVMPSPLFDTSVPHIARVYNYWLAGRITSPPTVSWLSGSSPPTQR
jgi:hypothetical protein